MRNQSRRVSLLLVPNCLEYLIRNYPAEYPRHYHRAIGAQESQSVYLEHTHLASTPSQTDTPLKESLMIPRTSIIRSASSVSHSPVYCPAQESGIDFTRSSLLVASLLLLDVHSVLHQSTWLLLPVKSGWRRIHLDRLKFLENIIGVLRQRGVGVISRLVRSPPRRQSSRGP